MKIVQSTCMEMNGQAYHTAIGHCPDKDTTYYFQAAPRGPANIDNSTVFFEAATIHDAALLWFQYLQTTPEAELFCVGRNG